MRNWLDRLDAALAAAGGTVSAWIAPAGAVEAAYARLPDATHYAASMMKVALLGGLRRRHDAGDLDMDVPVPVVNDFASARPGAPRFALDPAYDQDDAVWARLGGTAPLRWLARRMIIRSSNLAANIVLAHAGVAAAQGVLREAGAARMTVNRGIQDTAAREAGLDNRVTVRDLAALLALVTADPWMREVLAAQEYGAHLRAGVPPGTPIAQKDGWIEGARHAAGVVYPDDALPYIVAVATTGTAADAGELIAAASAAAWSARHRLGGHR